MGIPQHLSSLSCEINIIQAKNVDVKSKGNLFVRCYLSAGNNKRIQLNSQEISSKSNHLIWNESFSLESLGTEDSINNLKQQTVDFELRWQNSVPFLGKIGGSQLLGKAQIPWKTILESPNMEFEKWVVMVPKKSFDVEDVKPPSIEVAMRIKVPKLMEMDEKRKRKSGRLKKWDECGCQNVGWCSCEDYDIFALVAAFEAL